MSSATASSSATFAAEPARPEVPSGTSASGGAAVAAVAEASDAASAAAVSHDEDAAAPVLLSAIPQAPDGGGDAATGLASSAAAWALVGTSAPSLRPLNRGVEAARRVSADFVEVQHTRRRLELPEKEKAVDPTLRILALIGTIVMCPCVSCCFFAGCWKLNNEWKRAFGGKTPKKKEQAEISALYNEGEAAAAPRDAAGATATAASPQADEVAASRSALAMASGLEVGHHV